MVQVTVAPLASGRMVNSVRERPAKGLMNSSLISTRSPGTD
jgi:hypothetical protein